MNNENYGIFNEKEIERKREIIGKLSTSPTGRSIIAAQLKGELKKRCNANGRDMIMCNYICPDGIFKIDGKDDAYIFWADMNKCSVDKELLLSVMKDMVEETKQFMDTKIMIQIIEREEKNEE